LITLNAKSFKKLSVFLFVGGAVVLVFQFEQVGCQIVPQGRQFPIALALKFVNFKNDVNEKKA